MAAEYFSASGALTTFTYDAADQIMSRVFGTSNITFTFDGAGNVTNFHSSATPQRRNYTWDNDNRMVRVNVGNNVGI